MRLPRFTADAALYQTRQHYKAHLRHCDLAEGNHALAGEVHAAAEFLPFPTDYADCLDYCDKECGDQCTDLFCYLDCYDPCQAVCKVLSG